MFETNNEYFYVKFSDTLDHIAKKILWEIGRKIVFYQKKFGNVRRFIRRFSSAAVLLPWFATLLPR